MVILYTIILSLFLYPIRIIKIPRIGNPHQNEQIKSSFIIVVPIFTFEFLTFIGSTSKLISNGQKIPFRT